MPAIKLRLLTPADIQPGHVEFQISIETEDTDFRNEFDDPESVADIERRLDAGEVEAWCLVIVTAHWRGFKAIAALGGVSLGKGELVSAYVKDNGLLSEALDNLNRELQDIAGRLSPLVQEAP